MGAVAAGFVFLPWFIGEHQAAFWRGSIYTAPSNHVLAQREDAPAWVSLSPLVVTAAGALFAAWLYLLKPGLAAMWAARKGPLYLFIYNKWYFDELYQATFVRGAKALGDLFWIRGDKDTIDKLGPNGFAWMSALAGRGLSRMQTGYLYHYAFVMLIGVAGLLSFALWAWNR